MEKEKILKALETIQEVCQAQETCCDCPLRDVDDTCMFDRQKGIPCHWEINFEDRPWRAFRY